MPTLPSLKAYPKGKKPINVQKIDDIKKLDPHISDDEKVKLFYKEILQWPIINTDDLIEEL